MKQILRGAKRPPVQSPSPAGQFPREVACVHGVYDTVVQIWVRKASVPRGSRRGGEIRCEKGTLTLG